MQSIAPYEAPIAVDGGGTSPPRPEWISADVNFGVDPSLALATAGRQLLAAADIHPPKPTDRS